MRVDTGPIMEAVDALADKRLPVVVKYNDKISIHLNAVDWEIRGNGKSPSDVFQRSSCSMMMSLVVHVMKRLHYLPLEYVRLMDNGKTKT